MKSSDGDDEDDEDDEDYDEDDEDDDDEDLLQVQYDAYENESDDEE